ncbi:MAG: GNAT family N-acetyltransferase [Lachnospiraceae bacterium]|nr:GNAT family N-acetyltransferase [Lachnospiraceae bacterium]
MTQDEETVILRPITREDTPLIVRWRNNPAVRANFIFRKTFTDEMHLRWFSDHIEGARDAVQWIVLAQTAEEKNPRPIGSVYFRDIDRLKGRAEYGVLIGEDDARGHGYGNEIARLACIRAREELGLRTLILRVYCDNRPAIRSYEHAGFVIIQKLPLVRSTDGEEKDMYLMEKTLTQKKENPDA